MNVNEAPLLELFTRLRQAGLPLGVEEYQLLLRAIQSGFGIPDTAALARLCCTLWIKSADEKRIFDYHFEQVMANEAMLLSNCEPSTSAIPNSEDLKNNQDRVKWRQIFRLSPYMVLGGAFLLGVSIVSGSAYFLLQRNYPPKFMSLPQKEAKLGEEYNYTIRTWDINWGDKLSIKATNKPSWLELVEHGDGTATLSGKPTSESLQNKLRNNQAKDNVEDNRVKLQVTDSKGATDTQEFIINEPSSPIPIWIFFVPIAILIIGYILFNWIIHLISKHRLGNNPSLPQPIKNPYTATPLSKLTPQVENEMQVRRAMRSTRRKAKLSHRCFTETKEYFPITRRQMKQSWRYLRRLIKEGPATELDVEATVNQIGRQGLFLNPVLVPRRVNRTKLLLLIDQDGSMIPFHTLSNQLAETAVRGGRLGQTDIYYFHNCPIDYLYHDPNHQSFTAINNILASLQSQQAVVLFFSDAGAARGGFYSERIKLTAEFLEKLKGRVRYMAWLNPIPRSRWCRTTAEKIACLVPMFELNRQGLR